LPNGRASRPVARKRKDQLLIPLGVTRNTSPAHLTSDISSRPVGGGFIDRKKASVSGLCTMALVISDSATPVKAGGTQGAQNH
jgi:hypothetical protein